MPINKPKVSIVLLNYNGYEDTIDCFQSLQKISYDNYNIVIVDNASPDMSMDDIVGYMQKNDVDYTYYDSPEKSIANGRNNVKVSLIQSGFNGGYGHGNNIGIKYALKNSADYMLILNNDTIVNSDFLDPMVQICEEDRNIGIASGKIYFYDRPDIIWFNGGKFSACTAKIEHFNFNEKDVGQTPKEPITFISGCMWLIPKKVFYNVGFINEEYFMYVEDLEFCNRVLKNNYTLKVCNNAIVLHKAGSSGGGHLSEFSVYWMSKNKMHFISKNFNLLCKITAYSYNILFMSFRWLYKKKFRLFIVHIKGVIDAIR